MAKKYGVSMRLWKIRRGFRERLDAYTAAYDSGDAEVYDRLFREYYAYVRRYREELNFPAERVEQMRLQIAQSDKLIAEIKYVEEKRKRLERELEEHERELDRKLLDADKRGNIKWQ